MLIIEVRELKRLSKKIRQNYMPLKRGEQWFTTVALNSADRVSIIADPSNRNILWVGRKK